MQEQASSNESMLANCRTAAPLQSCLRSVNFSLKSKTVVKKVSDNKIKQIQRFTVHEA